MRNVFICLILFFSIATQAQVNTDSCTMEISLLTCAPGSDLYSLFGHTAIRVRDGRRGMDIVYNYGTFDDSDPLFYVHFTRGLMRYSLSAETTDSFMLEYEYEHRAVAAQILNLSCSEKNQLYEALRNNTLDENRFYDYHFHTDNCTTRAARIIESNTHDSLIYKNILPTPGPSYRDMIHEYLDGQHQDWSKFGIDILLGSNLDIKPSNVQAIHFLPDYLFKGMDSAMDGNKPVVLSKQILLPYPATTVGSGWFKPMTLFIFIFALGVFLSFPGNQTPARIFDIIFFSFLGIIGLVMTYVWLGRVDDVCRNNIDILWALPTHLAVVFFIRKKTNWMRYYFLATAVIASILLIGFPWWFQRMNAAVLPLLGTIIIRSFSLFKKRDHAENPGVQR